MKEVKILIIGSGLFGCSAALECAKDKSYQIDLIDKENDIMLHASRCNHNRLHLGYHYLRSMSTAVQSIEGLLSFMFNYGNAAIYQFPNYYAIAKDGSKTSVKEFIDFCDQVGIGYDEEYPDPHILDPQNIASCFRVPEPIFDYTLLKDIVKERIHIESNINLRLNANCQVVKNNGRIFYVLINEKWEEYDIVVNVSYNNTNVFNDQLGIKGNRLLFEEVIIPYFLFPAGKFGLTIMDGEFCSIMPKGANKNEFLLYHVRNSVLQNHYGYDNQITYTKNLDNPIKRIYEDSAIFYPFLKEVMPFGFWQTIRTVHENKEDARVTELFSFNELDNYYVILSGKIPTCMQVALHLRHMIQGKTPKRRFKI